MNVIFTNSICKNILSGSDGGIIYMNYEIPFSDTLTKDFINICPIINIEYLTVS